MWIFEGKITFNFIMLILTTCTMKQSLIRVGLFLFAINIYREIDDFVIFCTPSLIVHISVKEIVQFIAIQVIGNHLIVVPFEYILIMSTNDIYYVLTILCFPSSFQSKPFVIDAKYEIGYLSY